MNVFFSYINLFSLKIFQNFSKIFQKNDVLVMDLLCPYLYKYIPYVCLSFNAYGKILNLYYKNVDRDFLGGPVAKTPCS